MDQDYKQKLADHIDNSDLPQEQKDLWQLFMLKSISDEDEAVYEAVAESTENLILLTQHLRDKILSMEQMSNEGWSEVTKEQKKFIAE
jgi:hypothetical protein